MVRKICLCSIISFLFISCLAYKNEYGQKRFRYNRFTIEANTNNNVYQLIDTTKIYEVISIEEINYKKKLGIVNKSYLKFYANGRLGEFYGYNKNDINSLNPKKARMALYNYKDNKLIIQFYFYYPQGDGLRKEMFHKFERDTLELISENYLSKYKMIPLSKEFLIFKPDW